MSHVAFLRDGTGPVRRLTTDRAILDAYQARAGLLWLHILDLDAEDEALLRGLAFHPLAIEDTLSDRYRRPKVDDYGDYLFLVLHGIGDAPTAEEFRTTELDVFVGPTFVVSSSLSHTAWAEPLTEHPERAMANGSGRLAYAVIDALVDSVLPVIERMDDVAEVLEERALEHPAPSLLGHILHLKRSVALVSRVMAPQRDLMVQVARGDYALLDSTHGAYFRDIVDHLERIEDLGHALRERADHLVVTYHSALGLRQNEAMRQLAIVASIFMPLTLLTGIYGMNFDYMPELQWRLGHFVVLAIIGVTVGTGTFWLLGRRILSPRHHRAHPLASFALEPDAERDAARRSAEGRDHVLRASIETREAPPTDSPGSRADQG